jgi:DNA-binding transcriptional regulator YiaG
MGRNQTVAKTEIQEEIPPNVIEISIDLCHLSEAEERIRKTEERYPSFAGSKEMLEDLLKITSSFKELGEILKLTDGITSSDTLPVDERELLLARVTKILKALPQVQSSQTFLEGLKEKLFLLEETELFAIPTIDPFHSVTSLLSGKKAVYPRPIERLKNLTGEKNSDLSDKFEIHRRVIIYNDPKFQAYLRLQPRLFDSSPYWQEEQLEKYIKKTCGPWGLKVFLSLLIQLYEQYAWRDGYCVVDINDIMHGAGFKRGPNRAFKTEDREIIARILDLILSLEILVPMKNEEAVTVPLFNTVATHWKPSETKNRLTTIPRKDDQGEIIGHDDCFGLDRSRQLIQVNSHWYGDALKGIPGRDPQFTWISKLLVRLPIKQNGARLLGLMFARNARLNIGKELSYSVETLLKRADMKTSGKNFARDALERLFKTLELMKKKKLIEDFRHERRGDGPLKDMIHISPAKVVTERLSPTGQKRLEFLEDKKGNEAILSDEEFFAALTDSGMTSGEIAERFGVSRQTVSQWRKKQTGQGGKSPSKKARIMGRKILAEYLSTTAGPILSESRGCQPMLYRREEKNANLSTDAIPT